MSEPYEVPSSYNKTSVKCPRITGVNTTLSDVPTEYVIWDETSISGYLNSWKPVPEDVNLT